VHATRSSLTPRTSALAAPSTVGAMQSIGEVSENHESGQDPSDDESEDEVFFVPLRPMHGPPRPGDIDFANMFGRR
jgi:hypothetical protein